MPAKKLDLPKISKSRITLNGGGNASELNLSEEELRRYNAAMGITATIEGEDAEKQVVSKVKHDEEVSSLKEKIVKKDEKIGELGKEKKELTKERDSYKKQLGDVKKELKIEKEKVLKLTNEKKEVSESFEKFKKLSNSSADADKQKVAELEGNVGVLKSEKTGLSNQIELLKKEIEELKAEHGQKVAELEGRLTEINEENESLRQRPVIAEEEHPSADSGVLKRISASELYSEMFTDGRYDVKIARSGSHMLFIPNLEGSAECKDNMIILPRLSELLPFKAPCEYRFVSAGNNVLRAELI